MNPVALGSRWLAYAENKVRKGLISKNTSLFLDFILGFVYIGGKKEKEKSQKKGM